MAFTSVEDNWLQESKDEFMLINEQLAILTPLATELRKPAAKRFFSSTMLVLTELFCYALFIGGIAFMIMAPGIYPFSVMNTIYHSPEITYKLGSPDINNLLLAGYAILLLCSLLCLIMGCMARAIRLKNSVLSLAGKDIKMVTSHLLERKTAICAREQRQGNAALSLPAKGKMKDEEVSKLTFEDEGEEDDEEIDE